MHIALVFAAANLTDKDEQLVRAVAALPNADRVTLCAIREQRDLISRVEALRAVVERTVVRAASTVRHMQSEAGGNVQVGDVDIAPTSAALNLHADCIVNLAGIALAIPSGDRCNVLELWFDGTPAKSLGLMRAHGEPPRDIVVSVMKNGDHTRWVAERSLLTLTPGTPAGDRRNAASRAIALLLRALMQPEIVRQRKWSAGRTRGSSILSALGAASAIVGIVASAVLRRSMRPIVRSDAWEIRYRTNVSNFVGNTKSFTPVGFRTYRSDYQRFVADPIAIEHNGVHALFFEEYPHATRIGIISCAILQDDGTLSASRPVLERPYHLSYPFVFTHNEEVFMIPESSANKSVDLYRCTAFPYQWEFQQTLLSDVSITDATIHFDGQRWWLFATAGEFGSYSWDELHLYMADAPTGPWRAHPGNPVKCDPRTARPAGQLFWRDGRLVRPTQDCSKTYGQAVNLCEIKTLTPMEFEEVEVGCVSPHEIRGMDGLHTLSATSRLEVIDVRPRYRWRWQRNRIFAR